MTDKNEQSPPNSPPQRRRSSFAGQAFADMFGRSSRPSEPVGNSPSSQGPIATAAAEASRRRLSLSTIGLGGSPQQSSPFSARARGESVSSSNGGSIDESAVEDEPSSAAAGSAGPFARRVSFGARALKDMKGGGSGSNGRVSTSTIAEEDVDGEKKTSAPTSSSLGRRDRFNWADNMRSRAERGSIAGLSASPPTGGFHARAKSIAVMDHPVRDNPKPVNVPDQFQERILKGDFYMD